jgi:hypothetical protein
MEPKMQRDSAKLRYEPPALVSVMVDPVKDLLMTCNKSTGACAVPRSGS